MSLTTRRQGKKSRGGRESARERERKAEEASKKKVNRRTSRFSPVSTATSADLNPPTISLPPIHALSPPRKTDLPSSPPKAMRNAPLSQTRVEKKTAHHRPRVGDACRLDEDIVKLGSAAAAPALELLERVHEVGPQGAADAAALEVDDVLLGDEVGRDCKFFFLRGYGRGGEEEEGKRTEGKEGKKRRRRSRFSLARAKHRRIPSPTMLAFLRSLLSFQP